MKLLRRIWRYFNPEYILYITHRGERHQLHVKEFYKKTPKRITGCTVNGEEFEFVSGYPMDYQIKQHIEDLD